MHLVYYDESGDDGYPQYSSPLFVLSCIYLPAVDWREDFEILAAFRRTLAHDFHFPFKTELHTREFLLNLPKNSRQSWFIQLADMVACIVYLHVGLATATASLPSRLPHQVDARLLNGWLTDLSPVFNLRASRADPYGIVFIPNPP